MSPKTKKIAPNCNIFAIRDRASSPDRRLRPENAAKWLYCDSFPLCGSEGEPPIAKKLQKARYFCFCDWLIVAMGQTAKDESHTHRNQGIHLQSDKKNRPKAVSFSNIWLGQQDSNLHNWYQKPGSCHWTMAQRMP